jgi:hypothetical protein
MFGPKIFLAKNVILNKIVENLSFESTFKKIKIDLKHIFFTFSNYKQEDTFAFKNSILKSLFFKLHVLKPQIQMNP